MFKVPTLPPECTVSHPKRQKFSNMLALPESIFSCIPKTYISLPYSTFHVILLCKATLITTPSFNSQLKITEDHDTVDRITVLYSKDLVFRSLT